MAVRSNLGPQMGHSPNRPVRAQVGLRLRGEEAEFVAICVQAALHFVVRDRCSPASTIPELDIDRFDDRSLFFLFSRRGGPAEKEIA